MFARLSCPPSVASLLGLVLAGTLAVACGGAPESASEDAPTESVQSPLAPSACHGGASATGVVGITCDSFSPAATGFTLERLQGGVWVPIEGPAGKTPDLTDEGSDGLSTNNGPPADPTYPRDYHVRAAFPTGEVVSAPIHVVAP